MSATRVSGIADELFMVNGALPDPDVLLAAAGPRCRVLVLDPAEDGVLQLARAVGQDSDLKAIHILGRVGPSMLRLDSAELDAAALPGYADALATIARAMAGSGDVRLYDCDVAQGSQGQAFIEALADALQVDMAASIDQRGLVLLGGDWAPESHTGPVTSGGTDLTADHEQALAAAISVRLPFDSPAAWVIASRPASRAVHPLC